MAADLELAFRSPSIVAANVTIRRAHRSSLMRGWEAFGCEDDNPDVRELAHWEVGEDWPPGELRDGVACVEIHTYGDHPAGAYIYVCGATRHGVENAWHRARVGWVSIAACTWGGPV